MGIVRWQISYDPSPFFPKSGTSQMYEFYVELRHIIHMEYKFLISNEATQRLCKYFLLQICLGLFLSLSDLWPHTLAHVTFIRQGNVMVMVLFSTLAVSGFFRQTWCG